jgi:hypothetical protein
MNPTARVEQASEEHVGFVSKIGIPTCAIIAPPDRASGKFGPVVTATDDGGEKYDRATDVAVSYRSSPIEILQSPG